MTNVDGPRRVSVESALERAARQAISVDSEVSSVPEDVGSVSETIARNIGLGDLLGQLETLDAAKHDVVVAASALRVDGGKLVIPPDATDEGLAEIVGTPAESVSYRMTNGFREQIADKTGVPRTYARRCAVDDVELLDTNLNAWLSRMPSNVFVRTYRHANGAREARAMLSPRYRVIDNHAALTAALEAIMEVSPEPGSVMVSGADLTESKMLVRFNAPGVSALAPELLGNYRSPYSGLTAAELPVIEAGFQIQNSEVGRGRFSIVPRFRVLVCNNGLQYDAGAVHKVHLGAEMDEGVVWGAETTRAQLALIREQVKDAVRAYLNPDWFHEAITSLREVAETPLAKPVEVIDHVCKTLRYSDDTKAQVLDFFVKGGDTRAMGVAQAITAMSQSVANADAANELEATAMNAMRIAAAYAGTR